MENTIHYALHTPLGDAQWKSRLPSGDGLIQLGPSGRVFSVGLFHELRCLNIIRSALGEIFAHPEKSTPDVDGQPPLVKHCMDYIRQMVLCHADLTVMNIKTVQGRGHVADSAVTRVCKDHGAIFAAAEENSRMRR
jgi:hypothetical protein